MNVDIINGLFELLGAVFTWRNAWQLHKDRQIAGVYWPTTAFFAAWGVWNLYYYPALGQWFSFAGGIILVAGNVLWVAMAIRLKLRWWLHSLADAITIWAFCIKPRGTMASRIICKAAIEVSNLLDRCAAWAGGRT